MPLTGAVHHITETLRTGAFFIARKKEPDEEDSEMRMPNIYSRNCFGRL